MRLRYARPPGEPRSAADDRSYAFVIVVTAVAVVVQEGAIDLFGVDTSGASALVRVTSFRNHFYVQLAGQQRTPVASGIATDAAGSGGLPAGPAGVAVLTDPALLSRILGSIVPARMLL